MCAFQQRCLRTLFLFPLLAAPFSYAIAFDGYMTVVGEDLCSDKITLSTSFKFGSETINSLYVCQNGYVSLGDAAPEIMTSPSEHNALSTSTILAPALLKNHHVANLQGVGAMYKEEFHSNWAGGENDVNSTNSTDSEDYVPIDPYFQPSYTFTTTWMVVDTSFQIQRLVVMLIACDPDVMTSGGLVSKCMLSYHYNTLLEMQDPVSSEFMRAGVYSPGNQSPIILLFRKKTICNIQLLQKIFHFF